MLIFPEHIAKDLEGCEAILLDGSTVTLYNYAYSADKARKYWVLSDNRDRAWANFAPCHESDHDIIAVSHKGSIYIDDTYNWEGWKVKRKDGQTFTMVGKKFGGHIWDTSDDSGPVNFDTLAGQDPKGRVPRFYAASLPYKESSQMTPTSASFEDVAEWLTSGETCSEANPYTRGGFKKVRSLWPHELDKPISYEDVQAMEGIPESHKSALCDKFKLKPATPDVKPGQHWQHNRYKGDCVDVETYVVLQKRPGMICTDGSHVLACLKDGNVWALDTTFGSWEPELFTLIKDV